MTEQRPGQADDQEGQESQQPDLSTKETIRDLDATQEEADRVKGGLPPVATAPGP
jgi:hypothetical protein